MRIIIIFDENFFYRAVLDARADEVAEILKQKEDNYKEITIPKHSGERTIHCIKNDSQLYRIQRNLVDNFLSKVPLPDTVYGFVKERSYRDFLVPHQAVNKETRHYLRLDIKDFFGSIDSPKIQDSVRNLINLSENQKEKLVTIILGICTLDNILPQGAVTSPVISNVVFKRLDIRIRNYCRKLNVTYSRYADDLLFSTSNEKNLSVFFVKKIIGILKSNGFTLNRTKIKRGKTEISLNGFIIGNNIRLSRKRKKDIISFIYLYLSGGKPKNIAELQQRLNDFTFCYRQKLFASKSDIINYLAGYRSFLIDWLPDDKENYVFDDLRKIINKIEEIIVEVEMLE